MKGVVTNKSVVRTVNHPITLKNQSVHPRPHDHHQRVAHLNKLLAPTRCTGVLYTSHLIISMAHLYCNNTYTYYSDICMYHNMINSTKMLQELHHRTQSTAIVRFS